MPVAGVGFDLDETLVVPDRERARLLEEAAEAVGAPPLSREAYLESHRRNLTGRTRAPIFEDLLEGREADVGARDLARTYRELVNEALVPLDGVDGLLDRLQAAYRVGLLTNGPTRAQRAKLETLGWTDRFDATVVTGELRAGKPDRAAFDALLDALGTAAEETAYVGDEVGADVAGAVDAGLVVVQITYEGGPDPDPRADAHLPRTSMVRELPGLLERL